MAECACQMFFFFQAEDGIRDLVRSRGLGDVYKRQVIDLRHRLKHFWDPDEPQEIEHQFRLPLLRAPAAVSYTHLTLPTSDLV